ncbi:hypothetical protein G5I_06237 [Acromyrmex echinatior]|uniref:Uncharacterized protein n=1 Tax=Acromyrmex echinatior TaxID=103372 RepID=F4WKF0_ACREC|nr:hypothetical protein G5I_06237 [Acromyrmex echinatior]
MKREQSARTSVDPPSGIARLICPITLNNPRDNSIAWYPGTVREVAQLSANFLQFVNTRRWLEKVYSLGLFHDFDEKETETPARGKGPSRERITRRQSVIPLVRTSPQRIRKIRVSCPQGSSRKMHQQALTAYGVNSPSGEPGLPPKPLTGGPYTGFSFLFFKIGCSYLSVYCCEKDLGELFILRIVPSECYHPYKKFPSNLRFLIAFFVNCDL